MSLAKDNQITIAHDYFTQRGGAERVAAALISALNPSRVVTAVFSTDSTFPLDTPVKIETTFLQHLRPARRDPRHFLFALPLAWHLLRPVKAGVVICSSSGWSHYIRVAADARKVVYCHNPARWLYQPQDFLKDHSRVVKAIAKLARRPLIAWDRRNAATADVYIANSAAVAARIQRAYGRTATIINPPVAIDTTETLTPVNELEPGYFLAVGRGRGYKNLDLLASAFEGLPHERLVVVTSHSTVHAGAHNNLKTMSDVTDSELRWLYSHARALISISDEDFGLTPIEANAFGTPSLVLRAGGFLDSLDEHVSGEFIESRDESAIRRAILDFPRTWRKEQIIAHAEEFSTSAFISRLLAAIDNPEEFGDVKSRTNTLLPPGIDGSDSKAINLE